MNLAQLRERIALANSWLLAAVFFCIPVQVAPAYVLSAAMLALWTIEGRFGEKLRELAREPLVRVVLGYYGVLLLSMLWTDDSGWGQSAWGDRLCTATDGLGHVLSLRMPLYDLGSPPTGAFDAYGIVNQESGSGSDGRFGYELFVTSIAAEAEPVPEPATMTLLAIGTAAAGWSCRRRKRE